jgi:hypothetical protein
MRHPNPHLGLRSKVCDVHEAKFTMVTKYFTIDVREFQFRKTKRGRWFSDKIYFLQKIFEIFVSFPFLEKM